MKSAIKQINELASYEFDESIGESLRSIIRDLEQAAIRDGQPEIVRLCQVKSDVLSFQQARQIIAACIAVDKSDEVEGQYLTPGEVAAILRVSENKILAWIKSGKLPAVNVNEPDTRPCYKVNPDSLSKLEETTPEPEKPKRRSKSKPDDYIDFASQL